MIIISQSSFFHFQKTNNFGGGFMKTIDTYVNDLFKGVPIKNKELKENKEEIRNYLYEAVNDLLQEGKSEEEAINIALEHFGDNHDITKGFAASFRKKKNLVKALLYSFIICLLISIVGRMVVNHFYTIYVLETNRLLANELNLVDKENALSSKNIEAIDSELKAYPHKDDLQYLAIYYNDKGFPKSKDMSGAKVNLNQAIYTYPSKFIKNNISSINGAVKNNWYVQVRTKFNYDQYFMNWSKLLDILNIITAILFVLWAVTRMKYAAQMKKIQEQ